MADTTVPPAESRPDPIFEELERAFQDVVVPPITAPADQATYPELVIRGATGLDPEDREAIGQRRAEKLKAELREELAGTEVDDWRLFAFDDLARSVGGGLRDAGQEVVDSLRTLSDALGVPDNISILGHELPRITGNLPAVAPPETLAGEIARPFTSFLAGFIPMARAARAAGVANRLVADVVAAGAAGALTMPTDQPSIADALAQIPGLDRVVPEFLLSDPGDTEAEAKFKRAFGEAVGVGVGEAVLRPVIAGMRFLRARGAIRNAVGRPPIHDTPARRIPQEQIDRLNQLFTTGADPAHLIVPEERILAAARGAQEAAQRIVKEGASDDRLAEMLRNLGDVAGFRGINEGIEPADIFGSLRVTDAALKRVVKRVSRMAPEQLARADPHLTIRMLSEPGSRGRTLASYWTNSILLNVPGRAIDVITNAANAFGVLPAERFIATTVTRGLPTATRELRATAFGMMQSLDEAFRLAGRAFNEGRSIVDPQFVRAEATTLTQPRSFGEVARQGSLAIVGDVLTKGAFRTIAAGDDFFKTLLARGELHRLAAREMMDRGLTGEAAARELERLVAHPTDDMLRAGLDTARYGTFTRPLGDLGEAAIRFRDEFPLARFVVPFGRTPSNIVKFAALDRTPLGVFSREVRRDIVGANGREAQALAITRMSLGSAFLALAAKWAADGTIVGGGPVDPALRRIALGDRPPYSIRVGDHHVTFNQFSPIGTLLSYGADLAGVAGFTSQNEFDQLHAAILVSTYRNLLDVPLFDGFATLAHVLEGGARGEPGALLREVGQTLGPLVPGLVAGVERAVDPNIREARTLLDAIMARVPGLSDELPVRLDPLGEPFAPKVGFSDSMAERFLSPMMVYKDQKRLRDVREFLAEHGLKISYPERSIRGVPIDSATYQRLVQRRAELALPGLRKLIGTASFIEAPQEVQQNEISNLFAKTTRAAAGEIIEGDPLLRIRIEQVQRFEASPEEASMRRGPFSLQVPR